MGKCPICLHWRGENYSICVTRGGFRSALLWSPDRHDGKAQNRNDGGDQEERDGLLPFGEPSPCGERGEGHNGRTDKVNHTQEQIGRRSEDVSGKVRPLIGSLLHIGE